MQKERKADSKKIGMEHMNGNLLCAINVETTGDDPFYHDICEITLIPVDYNIERMKNADFFHAEIQPKHKDRIDPETMSTTIEKLTNISIHGLRHHDAEEALERWFDKLNLMQGKKIMPLAHGWYRLYPFLRLWLGKNTYEYIFHEWCRDVESISLYNNDYAFHHIQRQPFAKNFFAYMCGESKVDRVEKRYRDSMTECLALIDLYRTMCANGCRINNGA